jgi:peptidoglycan/LPS O-acetylase OafA/YrhL
MATRSDIPALTGLRGVAALLVVTNHLVGRSASFQWAAAPNWLQVPFSLPGYGMTLFFTLSGFVIAYNYWDFGWDRTPLQSLGRFAFLRFSRLWPALLLFLSIMTAWPLLQDQQGQLWLLLHVAGAQSWLPFKLDGVLPADSRYSVSWSISTEMMLYVAFAATMLLRRARVWLLAAIVIYVAGVVALILSPGLFAGLSALLPNPMEPLTERERWTWFFYLSPYYRLVEFVLGGAAALAVMRASHVLVRWQQWVRRVAATAVIGLVLLYVGRCYGWLLPIPLHQLLSALLFAAILLNCTDDSHLNRALARRWIVFVGTISYSLYLFHGAVPALGTVAAYDTFMPDMLPEFALRFAISVLLAIAAAAAIYGLFERPAQQWLRAAVAWRPIRRRSDLEPRSPAARSNLPLRS